MSLDFNEDTFSYEVHALHPAQDRWAKVGTCSERGEAMEHAKRWREAGYRIKVKKVERGTENWIQLPPNWQGLKH